MPKQHTFGGSALDRHIFDYEVDPLAGDASVGDSPPAEPTWTGPSQDEWQAAQDQLAQYEHMVAQQQQQQFQQQQQVGPPIPDPYDPDNWPQQFQAYIDAQMAPYQQFQQQVQLAEAEERAMGMLDQHAASLGQFDREMAFARANQLIHQYGNDPRAAEKALEQAAKETLAYERRVGEAYYQQQLEQIQQVAGAPRGLPAGQGGAQTVHTGGYGNVPNAVTTRLFGHR